MILLILVSRNPSLSVSLCLFLNFFYKLLPYLKFFSNKVFLIKFISSY